MAFVHSPKVVTDGLVLYLDAANTKSYPGSGTTAYDLTNSSYTGTLTNGPTFQSNNCGTIQFDGVNDYIDFSTNASRFAGLLVGTYSVWFRVTNPQNGGTLITVAEGSDPMIMSIGRSRRYTSGSIIIDDDDGGSSGPTVAGYESGSVTNNTLYMDGIWHNAVLVCETNANKVYVDGRQITMTYTIGSANVGNFMFPASVNVMNFGRSYENASGNAQTYFSGEIGLAMMHSKPLSATEILQNYNATRSRFGV